MNHRMQSPVVFVERNSYNHNSNRIENLQQFRPPVLNMTNGFDRFGNQISNTSLAIASPVKFMVADDIPMTPPVNHRPMSPDSLQN